LADFDELLAALHDRGIKLVMDLVVNHTSDEHPWFIESRSSTDNSKRNWYWWRGPREGMRAGDLGAEPTNWQSFFSGSAWEFDSRASITCTFFRGGSQTSIGRIPSYGRPFTR
jgi:oligo-1,6-glucosidase